MSRKIISASLLSCLVLVSSAFNAFSQVPDELQGEWITRGGPLKGARLEIRRNFDTQDSQYGQGRIVPTAEWAANYVIVYQGNRKCYFYISLSNDNRDMEVEVKSPGTASREECVRGYFVRRSDSGGQ